MDFFKISEKKQFQIDQVLSEFVEKADVDALILVSLDGYLLAKKGDTEDLNSNTITTLAMSVFSAASKLSDACLDEELKSLSHQGKDSNIYLHKVTENVIFLVIYQQSTLSKIRLFSNEAKKSLKPILE